METEEYVSEIDQLLQKVVERGEALKMPKPKPHWKQLRKKRLEAEARKRARGSEIAYRKRLTASPRRKYNELKRISLKRGQEWDIAYSDWAMAWICAKPVNGGPAIQQTGRGKGRVKVERIDNTKGWTKDNFQIICGKEVLWP